MEWPSQVEPKGSHLINEGKEYCDVQVVGRQLGNSDMGFESSHSLVVELDQILVSYMSVPHRLLYGSGAVLADQSLRVHMVPVWEMFKENS